MLIPVADGKPNADRNWTECFAQLVGTVLSLWDAAALDAAGQDGEVAPTFVNLADASIKMVGVSRSRLRSRLTSYRSKHYLRVIKTSNLYRTFSPYQLLARIAISFISTPSIR